MSDLNARTRVKVCGITRAQDLEAAAEAGVDAIGLVFYERSPRHVTLAKAVELALKLPAFMAPVGLFVNAAPADVDAAVREIPQLLLQFHGDETAADCGRHRRPFLRAARIAAGFDLLDFATQFADAQALLLDAHVEGFGGGGKVFDWSLIPANVHRHLVLSGGLHAGNVVEGILRVRPWAVDVSSGVESAKGIKDAAAIRSFCQAVREADARSAETSIR